MTRIQQIRQQYSEAVCICGQPKDVNSFFCLSCALEAQAEAQRLAQARGREEAYCPDCYDQTRGGHIRWCCVRHPELGHAWSGKNIPGRHLFFDWRGPEGPVSECSCTDHTLVHECPITGKRWNMSRQEV